MNNGGKLLLGAGLIGGAILLITRSAKGSPIPLPYPEPDPGPNPNPNAPTVGTDPADAIYPTEAMLHGSVIDLKGAANILVAFLIGETTAYEMAPSPTQQIQFPMTFQARITGLTPNTTYHYNVLATGNGQSSYGGDQVFTTPPLNPTTTGFSLRVVNPAPNNTLFWFDFGGELMWEPAYFNELSKIKPTPIGQRLTFPLFIPGGTPLNIKIGRGTLNPDGSYTNGGMNYMKTVPIENGRDYVYDDTARTLSLA